MAEATTRGVAPVVGKALEIGVVLAYVGLLAGALYGGVVPDARAASDDAVAERALAAATERVRAAVPAVGTGTARATVPLPDRIGGEPYVVVPDGGRLVLEHPDPAVDARVALLLPERVVRVTGRWESTARTVVRVRSTEAGLVVRLVSR